MLLKVVVVFILFRVANGDDGSLPKSTRIVGGRLALKNEIPYIVALVGGTPPNTYAFCGGSIIDPRFILTAAHCFEHDEEVKHMFIFVGALNVRQWSPTQVVQPKSVIRHEKFDNNTLAYDIALLELAQPLKFNDAVQPIALPKQGEQSSGGGRVSGWGETKQRKFGSKGNPSSDLLKTTEVKIVAKNECLKYYRETAKKDVVHNSKDPAVGIDTPQTTHICAGVPPKWDMDPCEGDSGGPLVCSHKVDGKVAPYLCGIVSGGVGCAVKLPAQYTEVSQFRDWIAKIMKGGGGGKFVKFWGFVLGCVGGPCTAPKN